MLKHNYLFVFIIFFISNCDLVRKNEYDLIEIPINFESELPKRISYLEKMQSQYPKNSHIPFLLSKLYLESNQPQEALIAVKKSISLSSITKKQLLVLSSCYFKLNDFEKSFQIIQKLNTQDLMDIQNLDEIIAIYMKLYKYKELEKLLLSLPKSNKLNIIIENNRTEIYLVQKDTLAAIKNIESILVKNPTNFTLQEQLNELYFATKQYHNVIRGC